MPNFNNSNRRRQHIVAARNLRAIHRDLLRPVRERNHLREADNPLDRLQEYRAWFRLLRDLPPQQGRRELANFLREIIVRLEQFWSESQSREDWRDLMQLPQHRIEMSVRSLQQRFDLHPEDQESERLIRELLEQEWLSTRPRELVEIHDEITSFLSEANALLSTLTE